jgi:hypothetical protein
VSTVLPSAYQIPAAVILLLGGTIACFFGYRLFRLVLGIYGFILGALIATSLYGPAEPLAVGIAAIVGGLLGALILNLAYFVGVALLGAAVGAVLLHIVWPRVATGDPHVLFVVLFAALGAVAAIWLQRIVIILATAFGGAWTLLVGGLALMGDRVAQKAAIASDVWVVYPLQPAPGREWVMWVWLAIGLVGAVVQLRRGPAVKVKKVKVKRR